MLCLVEITETPLEVMRQLGCLQILIDGQNIWLQLKCDKFNKIENKHLSGVILTVTIHFN